MYLNVHWSTVYNSQDMEASRCPLADEWIKKMWYMGIQWITTQLLKKKKRMPFAATWMQLEIII